MEKKEVDVPDRSGSRKKVDSRQLTVHRQEKGQRLNTENTEATEKKAVDAPERVRTSIESQKLKE
jgi:hypothetical protein